MDKQGVLDAVAPVNGPRKRWIWVASLTALAAVVGITAYSVWYSFAQVGTVRAQSDRVEHNYRVLLSGNSVLSLMKDVETGERGFVLTGDTSYLEPYTAGRAAVGGELDRLAALVSDNPGQAARVEVARGLIAEKLLEAQGAVEARRQGGTRGEASAEALVVSGWGKRTMDALRAVMAAVNAEEARLLGERAAGVDDAERGLRAVILTRAALLVLLLGVGWLMVTALARGRAKLSLSRDLLATTLASIGDAVVTTDARGRVTYLNAVAEDLTGWDRTSAPGTPLETVFRIVNETTRATVQNPAERALREGVIVGLANHTVLIARDGSERPIDDSAAPIRDRDGTVVGCVLVFRDVTQRRETEEKLQSAHDRLEERVTERTADLSRTNRFLAALLDSLQEGVVACDAKGVLTLFNRATRAMHGLPHDGEPSERWAERFDLFRPDGVTRMGREEVPLFRALGGELVEDAEMVIAPKSGGERRILLASGRAFHDERGLVLGAVVSMHDVTRRRAAETALRAAHDGLEARVTERTRELAGALAHQTAILDSSLDSIVGMDHEGRITEFNAAAEKTFGWTRAEVLGRELASVIIPPSYRENHRKGLERHLATGQGPILGRRLEMSAIRADGSEFPVELAVTRVGLEGAPTFMASLRDITERLRIEAEVHEREKRLRFVMDSMPQKVFTAGPDGSIDYFNPQWGEFTGLSFEQIRGWGWTRFVHPDDLDENVRAWRRCVETGEPFHFEHRFQRSDGEYRWHLSRAESMRDGAGRVMMWVGSNTDIHEQKQTAIELRQLAAELSDADRRKNHFLAMLAHELRNPLMPVRTGLAIIKQVSDGPEGERARAEMIPMMERQVANMSRLIDDLMDVARVTQGKVRLHKEIIELAPLVERSIEAVRARADECGHRLSLRPSPRGEKLLVEADPTRLEQVFSNLLTNACKYTPRGGQILLTVERGGPDGQEAVVRVCDDGIGIDPGLLPRVFDLFVQADDTLARSQGGLGIGLTMVKNLVDLHGGRIEAHSPPESGGKSGSEFVVSLPLAAGARASGDATVAEDATEAPSLTGPRRVLVVDDNLDAGRSLTVLLEQAGHTVRTVGDGLAAVKSASDFQPQVVLLDIGLPGLNGFEVARVLREVEQRERAEHQEASAGSGRAKAKDSPGEAQDGRGCTPRLVLVAVTGYADESTRVMAREAGFDYFLVKPVEPALLGALLGLKGF